MTIVATDLHASVFVDRLGQHPIVTRSRQATDAVIRERMRYVLAVDAGMVLDLANPQPVE